MPEIPRIGPGPVIPLRQVEPQDIGTGQGFREQGRAVSGLSEAAGALFESEQQARVSSGVAAVSNQLDAYRQELDDDPDLHSREQKFAKKRQEIVQKFRAEVAPGAFQRDFEVRANSIADRQVLAVRDGVRQRQRDLAAGESIRVVSDLYRMAREASSEVLRKGYLNEARNVIERAVASEAMSARSAAELTVRMDEELEQGRRTQTAQQEADAIFAAVKDPAERLRQAHHKYEGDARLHDQVIARLKDLNQEERYARDQGEASQLDELVRRAYDGKITHQEVAQIAMPAHTRASVEAILSARESGAGQVRTDLPTFYTLRSLFSDPSRSAEAAKINLYEYADRLTPDKFEQLDRLRRGDDPQASYVEKRTARVFKGALQYGLTRSPDEEGRLVEFQAAVDAELDLTRRRLRRNELSRDEIDQVVAGQIRDIAEQRFYGVFGTSHTPYFEHRLPPEERERVRVLIQKQTGVLSPSYEDILDYYEAEQRDLAGK